MLCNYRNSVLMSPQSATKKKGRKKRVQKPTCPIEKYNLRIQTAARTGKLDLSTRAVWPLPNEIGNKFPADKETFVNLIQNDNFEIIPWRAVEDTLEEENAFPENHEGGNDEEKDENGENREGVDDASLSEASDGENLPKETDNVYDYVFPTDGYSYGYDSDEGGSLDSTQSRKEQLQQSSQEEIDQKAEEEAELQSSDIVFRLNVIPQEVLSMKTLRELWLCNNYITSIPSEIGDLRNLTTLSLKCNKVTSLPPEVCLLDKLQVLLLSNNKLSFLPNLFGRLRDLHTLDIASNEFNEFPGVLTELNQLVSLDLSENKISILPNSLVKLKRLTLLTLTDNPIATAPDILKKTPWIDVKGCILPLGKRVSMPFTITAQEEDELLGLIKGRASTNITSKLRRRKKRNSYVV